MCGAIRDVRFVPIADITPFTLNWTRLGRLLAAAQGIFAVRNVGPAKDAGLRGVDGQAQPLGRSICRTLHRDARQVRHGQRVVDQPLRAARHCERMIRPEKKCESPLRSSTGRPN